MSDPIVPIKKDPNKTPQQIVSEFWDGFFSKKPGKVTSIFPRALYSTLLPTSQPRGLSTARNAAESYEAAARECREKVRRIVRECARTNEKFTDPDFDVESDPYGNCLYGLVRNDPNSAGSGPGGSPPVTAAQLKASLDTLVQSQVISPGVALPVDVDAMRGLIAETSAPAAASQPRDAGARRRTSSTGNGVESGEVYSPGSVHRVDWIFQSPQFTVDGYSSSDIKQGSNGDCWWLAAVATIAHRRDLMARVCVARDEECGVYGFVFQRDGDWITTVVDDNLFLTSQDFNYYSDTYDATGKRAREHRAKFQTGSEALYFAKCADPNETWLPLLEKAYAKIHGDYAAISGGWSGEAVEDMTGGVTTTVATNRVLRKDKLWKELANSDGDFVFALSAIGTGWDWQKGGLALGHAYSILRATEEVDEDGNKVRLVKIRNPWGQRAYNGVGEWNGPWSDGSKEWTPYWFNKLNHRFGDDGVFWMSYQDMLETFLFLHRTRLFDEKWTVVQQWTSINVGWVSGYLNTKFLVEVKKAGKVIFALNQLDERYFRGFEGQYTFALHFVLQEENSNSGDHICRVRPVHDWENRSVSCEVELEPGRYEVVPKITATRDPELPMVEDIVKNGSEKNPQKLRQVGVQYDLAHSKGGVPDEDILLVKKQEEKKKKEEAEKKKREEKEKKEKAKAKREKEKEKKLKAKEKAKAKKEKEKARKEKEKAKREKQKEKEKSRRIKVVVEIDETDGDSTAKDVTEKDDAASKEGDDKGESQPAKDTEKSEKKEDITEDAAKDEKKEDAKLKDGDATKEEKKEEPAKTHETASASSSEGAPTPGSEVPSEPTMGVKRDENAAKDDEKKDDEKKEEEEKDEEEKSEEEESEESEESEDEDDDDEDDDEDDESDSESDSDSEDEAPAADETATPPWNAVCVVGLRVYATDPDVTIALVKPKDADEASSLAVDATPAGATM